MTPVQRIGSLVAAGLRGLRARLLLTVGSVILAALALGAAVVGPMYQAGAAASYLVTRLQTEPSYQTGMVLDYYPPSATEGVGTALARGRELADHALVPEFAPSTVALRTKRVNALGGKAELYSEVGTCGHLHLVGRCPRRPGEAAMEHVDSVFTGLRIGDSLDMQGVARPLTIVGIYAPPQRASRFWFNPADLQSVPPSPPGVLGPPYLPAPLIVAASTFAEVKHGDWYVSATRRLHVTADTTGAEVAQTSAAVAAVRTKRRFFVGTSSGGWLVPEPGNELPAIAAQAAVRRSTAAATVAPAVVSVVLVALVLLLRLLAAAMDLRRSELALASLRGCSRRQLWFLGLVEPVLMLVLAAPLGVIGGLLSARALARVWLAPGLPTPLTRGSVLAVVAVVAGTLAVAVVVVRDSVGEPLREQIADVRRPARAGRWGLLLRLAVVAAAAVVLGATLAAGGRSRPGATDLALPILLAVAAGLLTTLAAQLLGRRWASWSSRRRGVFGYLASRTIARRREGTLVILPLTAALAVALFSAGLFTAAAAWRSSAAATIVGAGRSYSTALTLDQAVALTHQVDPAGRWLMAVGANYSTNGELVAMDTPRLPRVGVWPSSWTPGLTATDVARALAPARPSVVLRGSRVSLTVDNAVTGHYPVLGVDLAVTLSDGQRSDIVLWPFRHGVSTQSRRITGCTGGCLLTAMTFGGPAAEPERMAGTATVTSFDVDGRPVRAGLDESWRTARLEEPTQSGIAAPPVIAGGALTVKLASPSSQAIAAITPDDVPLVRPVIVGRTARLPVSRRLPGGDLVLRTDGFVPLAVHPVTTAESMPLTGPTGLLIDYTMLTRDVTINNSLTLVSILARSDTPAAVTAALAARGISQPQTLTATRTLLDQDAFALALNLYLVVSAIVIGLALAGLAANLVVQMPFRRRDAASLRVVGLRRRSIIAAVIAEFFVVLGAAGVAGILAGSLAQYVVVRTVTLGYADSEHTPRLLPSLDIRSIGELLVAVTVVLLATAVTVAALTVRGARTAGLREGV